MQSPLDVRKVSIAAFGGIGLLLVFIFLVSGMDSFGVLGVGLAFVFVAVCIHLRVQPGRILSVIGVPTFAAGVMVATTVTTTTTFDETGSSSTIDMEGLAVGIPLTVGGLVLMSVGHLLTRRHIGWPATLGSGLQSRLDSVRPPNGAPAAADVAGVVQSPVPPGRLHAAVLAAAESLSGAGIVVLEERPGLIRMGRARPGGPVEFAVHVEVTGFPTGSQARILVAFTQPSPVPGPGVLGGNELDRLLARIREELGAASPASQWV